MQLLRPLLFVTIAALQGALFAAGKVRDVNQQRNQATVISNKAGEFAMGAKVYFFRDGKPTGTADITMAFHTKAIARIATGNPKVGDDASTKNKPPKAEKKIARVSFATASVLAQEFLVDVQFENQEKQQRKLTLNAEVATQIAGAVGYIGLNAALIRQIDVVWQNGALQVKKIRLADKSAFEVSGLIAADLFAKIKPAAESRDGTVRGKIIFSGKARDLAKFADGIQIDVRISKGSRRVSAGKAYKLKIYCNELFATELVVRFGGEDIAEALTLNPVDLSPGENNLEVRLVEITEQGELQLETDENQLVGTLVVTPVGPDKNVRVGVSLSGGQNAAVSQLR